MKRKLLIALILITMLLSACGGPATPTPTPTPVHAEITPERTPTPIPTPTPTPTPTEREAIITFTRQALQIEAERAELMGYFVSVNPFYRGRAISRLFLKGVVAGKEFPDPGRDLEGMSSLFKRLFWLDNPQSMHAVKDALIYIYNSEIQQFYFGEERIALEATAAELESHKTGLLKISGVSFGWYIDPEVTKDNLDYWKQKSTDSPSAFLSSYQRKVDGPWGQLQAFRRDTYSQWSQLLQEHGIDPVKEGFTALVLK